MTTLNKTKVFWQKCRSIMRLAGRSSQLTSHDLALAEQEMRLTLELGILNYPPSFRRWGVNPNMTYQELKNAFGLKAFVPHRTPNEDKFLEQMRFGQQRVRQGNWAFRVGREAQELQECRWFPFFVTLTVDPSKADPRYIWEESREWQKYLRRLTNVVAKELGHKPPHKTGAKVSNYVRYVCALEHGKSRHHHHAHALIWLREIPSQWKLCPNRNVKNPLHRVHRRCRSLENLWPWCQPQANCAMYFRTIGDVWSELGFDLPVDPATQRPVKIGSPNFAGEYVVKYVLQEKKEWKHRVRATRALGLESLRHLLKTLPLQMLEQLTLNPQSSQDNLLMKVTQSVPKGLLKSEASLMLFQMRYLQGLLTWDHLTRRNYGSFQILLNAVKKGATPWLELQSERYAWLLSELPPDPNVCFDRTRWFSAVKSVAEWFPPQRNLTIG